MLIRIFIVFCILALSSCTTPRTVDFSNRIDLHGPSNTTRVFLDLNGNKYPSSGVPAGGFHLKEHGGSLLNAMRDPRSTVCIGPAPASETESMCRAARAAVCDDTGWCALDGWHAAQAAQWRAVAQQITAQTPPGGTIVFLIHGFNNTAAESSPNFDKAKLASMDVAADPRSVHFVEVYWDGCSTNENGIGCWSKAQGSGPLVGLALWPLFNALSEGAPNGGPARVIRVLTHSSGAFVAGSTFGNPVAALKLLKNPKKNPRYQRFERLAAVADGPWRVPQIPNLRVGMFAAATAPILFTGSESASEGWLAQKSELMIAIHPHDSALTKKVGLCNRLGYTCLGARFEDYCELVKSTHLAARSVTLRAYDFDRADWPWGADQDAHNFGVYVVQAAEQTQFFRDLIRADPPVAPNSGRYANDNCGTQATRMAG